MPERRKPRCRWIETIETSLSGADPECARVVLCKSVDFGWRGNGNFVAPELIHCGIERAKAVSSARPQGSLMIYQEGAYFIVCAAGCTGLMGVGNPCFCDGIKAKQASIERADPELARAVLRDGTNLGIFTDRLNIVTTGSQIDSVDGAFGPSPDHAVAVFICDDDVVGSGRVRSPLRATVAPKRGRVSGEARHSAVGSADPDAIFVVLEQSLYPVGGQAVAIRGIVAVPHELLTVNVQTNQSVLGAHPQGPLAIFENCPRSRFDISAGRKGNKCECLSLWADKSKPVAR